MIGSGWNESVFTFYDLAGALRARPTRSRVHGGRVVVNVVDMPDQVPVAPLEFCFLADWYFRRAAAFANDVELDVRHAARRRVHESWSPRRPAGGLLIGEARIELVTEFAPGEIDATAGVLGS